MLYAESQADTGVDDYGLSIARIVVAPQLAGLAALLGVVLTSLATSTLGGSPNSAPWCPTRFRRRWIRSATPPTCSLQWRSRSRPGLVFSRFRQNVEQTKRELTRTSSAADYE